MTLNKDGHLFLSTSDSLFYSTTAGATWLAVTEGHNQVQIQAMAFDNEGYLYAAATDAGLFRSTTPTTSSNVSTHDEPVHTKELALAPAFPNPFATTTRLRYTLHQEGFVTLSVFNVLGQRVALLVDGFQQAGAYDVSFSPDKLPGGVYFYRIDTESQSLTRAMTLIRN